MHSHDREFLTRLLASGTAPALVLDEMMGRWNGRWIMHGDAARCRQCQVPQWPSSAEQPVQHRANCPAMLYEYPWRDLAELLRELPMGPL
jgi:hypothetical protein